MVCQRFASTYHLQCVVPSFNIYNNNSFDISICILVLLVILFYAMSVVCKSIFCVE